MSYSASLSTRKVTSVCSSSECVDRMALYGSTTAVDTWGEGYTEKESFDFLP